MFGMVTLAVQPEYGVTEESEGLGQASLVSSERAKVDRRSITSPDALEARQILRQTMTGRHR
jgi:hypothetical protein